VLRREGQAEEAELPHRQHGVDGEDLVAVPLLGIRRDLRLREVAHDGAELLLFLGQVVVHGRIILAPVRALSVAALLEQLTLEAGVVVVRDGASTVVAAEPAHVRLAHGVEGFQALDAIEREGGWWAGFLAYDLGRAVERVVPWA